MATEFRRDYYKNQFRKFWLLLAFTAFMAAVVGLVSCRYSRQRETAFHEWLGEQQPYVAVEVR